jgi:cytoskeletal protein CcmA (bactofilin family)
MFNRDALFGKKEDTPRNEPRSSVNVTPGLGGGNPPMRPQPPAEPSKPDLRFAEMPKAQQQAQQPARAEEPAGSRLIVGPDIKLKGVEITDCDTLVVEGRVEASMDSRVIQIAENGVFSGTVSIDIAEIRGCFEGELTARKQLVIYSTGRVSGQIRYGKVRIEEGGELSGQISTLAKAPAPAEREAPAATTTPAATSSTAASTATAAAAAPAAAAPSAAPAASPARPTQQPAAPVQAELQPASASANREPAPSRPPVKHGSRPAITP